MKKGIMKKGIIILINITIILYLVSCTNQNNCQQTGNAFILPESNEVSIAKQQSSIIPANEIPLYKEFLDGDINVQGIDMNFLTIPTGEPDKKYGASYAFFDSNGDGIAELHVKSARYYYILTIRDNELIIWKDLSPYPYFYALNNGAFLTRKYGAGSMHDLYNYIILDYSGNQIYNLGFAKYDKNQNGIYDDNDEYLIDWIEVTKKQWDSLIEKYIYIDETGIERISNEIEWTVMYEDTN